LITDGDLTTHLLMEDMDPRLLSFVRTKVNSFIKWDLFQLFHKNPSIADTAENIARYTRRDASVVGPELEELVESGIMQRRTVNDDTIIYSLVEDPDTRLLIDQFGLACEDRAFRIKAIYIIISGIRQSAAAQSLTGLR
jgi:hypothetical protein